MKGWGLNDKGFNYNVIAVFGSQSTGKSKALLSYSLSLARRSERSVAIRYTPKQGLWHSFRCHERNRTQTDYKGYANFVVPSLESS